ncbi:MAG: hypothetical protein JRM80_07390 [Nitrososphaerota archaeon]|nr:hypothetical protein [Nitrososphaerota archaeon]MDG6990971.1 hypothetical protein [Nitrososphaerota archaeon]
MKPLPAIAAGTLAMFLLLAPALATAATYSVTVTASPASATGTNTITVTGSVSPVPTNPTGYSFQITVTNPSSQTCAVASEPLNAVGQFTYSFAAGGAQCTWSTGTYTVSASNTQLPASGSGSFTYTAPAPAPTGNALTVLASASTPLLVGQTAQVAAFVYWSNGTVATSAVSVTARITNPAGGQAASVAGTFAGNGVWTWAYSSTSTSGNYLAVVSATSGNAWGYGSAGFAVNSQLANQTTVGSLSTALARLNSEMGANFTAINTAITATASSVNTLASSVTSGFTSVTNAIGSLPTTANFNSINSAIAGLQTSVGNANSSISSTSTYVLVVAVLAAITLVLELAILVRKLS